MKTADLTLPPGMLASVMDGEHVAATVVNDGGEIRIKPAPGYRIAAATMSINVAKTTPSEGPKLAVAKRKRPPRAIQGPKP